MVAQVDLSVGFESESSKAHSHLRAKRGEFLLSKRNDGQGSVRGPIHGVLESSWLRYRQYTKCREYRSQGRTYEMFTLIVTSISSKLDSLEDSSSLFFFLSYVENLQYASHAS